MADSESHEFGGLHDPDWKRGTIITPPVGMRVAVMQCCAFTFDAVHTNKDGSLTCPLCEPKSGKAKRALTPRQVEVMAYLRDQIDANGFAPSLEEIAAHFGYQSLATVHEHLNNLARKGWISRAFNESRGITVLS